jgi:hypothetical protein
MKFGCAASHDLGNYLDVIDAEDKEAEAFADFVRERWQSWITTAIDSANLDQPMHDWLFAGGDAEAVRENLLQQLFIIPLTFLNTLL